jgi:hypothetical protein
MTCTAGPRPAGPAAHRESRRIGLGPETGRQHQVLPTGEVYVSGSASLRILEIGFETRAQQATAPLRGKFVITSWIPPRRWDQRPGWATAAVPGSERELASGWEAPLRSQAGSVPSRSSWRLRSRPR